MRVLLAHKFLKLTGGAEVFFREVGRVLQQQGHEVHYLATGSADEIDWSDDLRPEQATLIEAPVYSEGSTLSRASAVPQVIWSGRAKRAAAEVIERFRPDIFHAFAIHVHLSPSILKAAKEAGVPTVMTCNDYKHICPNYKLFHHGQLCFDCKGRKFGSAITNRCAKNSLPFSAASAVESWVHEARGVYTDLVDHYTFSADFMAGITQEFWPGRDFSWSKVMNPFDSASFTAPLDDDGYMLYFGRLIDEKGVDVLVEAARSAPQVPVKIVGNGPDEQMLRDRAADLANVEFLGPLWNDALNPILSRARAVVVPSIWHENFPYVINQAFAFGRPVIGSNRGGITELVDHGVRGMIYDASDATALCAAMTQLHAEPETAQRMGRDAKAWSDATFRDPVFYESLIAAYDRITDAHSRTGR